MLERYCSVWLCCGAPSTGDQSGGGCPNEPWTQAICNVKMSGLGLRGAAATALPAFVASGASCLPVVRDIFRVLESKGLAAATSLEAEYERRSTAALESLVAAWQLDSPAREQIRDAVKSTVRDAEVRWNILVQGQRGAKQPAVSDGSAANVNADMDMPKQTVRGPVSLQKFITKMFDEQKFDALMEVYERKGNAEEDCLRLEDLMDENQDIHGSPA